MGKRSRDGDDDDVCWLCRRVALKDGPTAFPLCLPPLLEDVSGLAVHSESDGSRVGGPFFQMSGRGRSEDALAR